MVIVGGGAIGASIAFHLAEAGVEDALLVEQAELGSGSTAKGAGGVRAMFSDELNVRIGLRSLEAWGAFGERPGGEIDLRRVGYLFLLSSRDRRRRVRAQRGDAEPARGAEPDGERRGGAGALAAGRAGRRARGRVLPARRYATPDGAVQGYATAARGTGCASRRTRRSQASSRARSQSNGAEVRVPRSRPTASSARPARGRARSVRWPAWSSR